MDKNIIDAGFVESSSARSPSFFSTRSTVSVNHEVLDSLAAIIKSRGTTSARLCLHEAPTAVFHEMLIAESRGHYCRPHMHEQKGESCHIIRGSICMIMFDDHGKVRESFILDGKDSIIGRIGERCWHTVIPLSQTAVYHEAKPGPFLGEHDSIFAPWAPDGSNKEHAKEYVTQLLRTLGLEI